MKMTQATSNDENAPKEVFSGNGWHAGLIKSLLDDAEIDSYISGGLHGILDPIDKIGENAYSVFVAAKDYEQAHGIVTDFEKKVRE
jgi:hypothetical protein